jgi:hypothetical protein
MDKARMLALKDIGTSQTDPGSCVRVSHAPLLPCFSCPNQYGCCYIGWATPTGCSGLSVSMRLFYLLLFAVKDMWLFYP